MTSVNVRSCQDSIPLAEPISGLRVAAHLEQFDRSCYIEADLIDGTGHATILLRNEMGATTWKGQTALRMVDSASAVAHAYDVDMRIGFGQVVVNGLALDDPYTRGLDELSRFDVVSDSGLRYRIEHVDQRRWAAERAQSTLSPAEGTIHRGGNALNRWYSFKRAGRFLSAGRQNVFINAVFGLIGELDSDARAF